jgi:two-component system cell cycle response regulator
MAEKSFMIVMSGCDAEHLEARAEQVRKAISDVPFSTAQGPIFVSLSIGAITIQNWDKSNPIEPLLKQADIALYRAKESGRNRVVYAEAFAAV